MLRRYEFREQWYVNVPIERVWPVIRDVSKYPMWWSQFVEAERRNDVDGVGAVVRVRAKSALPCHMFFEVEAVHEEPPPLTEAVVAATSGKPLLNVLAPLFKPFFAWNHEIMMRRGEQGPRRTSEF